MKSQFEDGYKQHLIWHEKHNDKLSWYGWYVQTGERLGMFIDGTFGISLTDFDNRVERRADGADFMKTTAPYAELHSRAVFVMRNELSTGKLLEEQNPSRMIQVRHYYIHAGQEKIFEEFLLKFREFMGKQEKSLVFTWYQLIDGGKDSEFMLMLPKNSWSDYEIFSESLGEQIEQVYGDQASAKYDRISASIKSTIFETWGYRRDLGYFPVKE